MGETVDDIGFGDLSEKFLSLARLEYTDGKEEVFDLSLHGHHFEEQAETISAFLSPP